MKIVVPMVLFAVCMGLFARRITPAFWWTLGFGITLIVLYNYGKT
jgi:hypothetical protein